MFKQMNFELDPIALISKENGTVKRYSVVIKTETDRKNKNTFKTDRTLV